MAGSGEFAGLIAFADLPMTDAEDLTMRLRLPICLACVLMAVPGWSAPADAGVADKSVEGSVRVALRWVGPAPLAAGDLLTCRVRVIPLGPGAPGRPEQMSVVVPGPAGGCALEVPLVWRNGAVPAGVMVIYEVDAVSASGISVRKSGAWTFTVAPGARVAVPVDL